MNALYFRSTEESGERNLCLSFGAIGFLMSMGIFVVEESWLELGVRQSYENFTDTVSGYLEAQGLNIK